MIPDDLLDALIASLADYRSRGVIDPWILSNGAVIEPLGALEELRATRKRLHETECKLAETEAARDALKMLAEPPDDPRITDRDICPPRNES